MNLLLYFMMFGKFLWNAVGSPRPSSSSAAAAVESHKKETAGDIGFDGDRKPAVDKRKIQDKIHQRYMNWVKKQGSRETEAPRY